MKANELRIGNLFNVFKDTPYPIAMIGITDVQLFTPTGDLVQDKIKDLQPIPLTEEWLLKFGFKYRNSGAGGQDQWAGYGFWELDDFYLLGNRKGAPVYYARYKPSETIYVHQLQNLYFALCQQELKIEL